MKEADQPSLLDVEPQLALAALAAEERQPEPTEEPPAEAPSALRDEVGPAGAVGPAPDPETDSETETETPDAAESVTAAEALMAMGAGEEPRLYYLTNRLNLNTILSSRMIAPRDSYQKYYSDLLERFPGWVPLLTRPPSHDLVELVTAERGAGAPVIVEFPLALEGLVGSSKDDVVFASAVALAQARAIHFRDQKAVREHKARGFSNVHPHENLIHVSPQLFADTAAPFGSCEAPAGATAVDWGGMDRLRGALSGAVASARSGEQLAIAAAALGASETPDGVEVPGWLRWTNLGVLAPRETNPDAQTADAVIFRGSYAVLSATDTADAWNRRDVLDRIRDEMAAAPGLSDADRAVIARELARVREVVNVERDFEPFPATGDQLTTLKALLLVLLRPELADLLSWSERETGADDATQVVAGVFAGCLRGLTRGDTQLRSPVFDDITAAWAVSVARGSDPALPQVSLQASDRRTELVVEGQVLRVAPRLLPDPVIVYQSVDESRKEAIRLVVAQALGWPITKTVRVEGDASIEEGDDALVITTTGSVHVSQTYPENDFVERLAATKGAQRRGVLELLTKG